MLVQPQGYALFTLLAGSDATVSVGTTYGGVSVYFQYNTMNFEETAGLVNYVHDGDVLGHYHYRTGGRY